MENIVSSNEERDITLKLGFFFSSQRIPILLHSEVLVDSQMSNTLLMSKIAADSMHQQKRHIC